MSDAEIGDNQAFVTVAMGVMVVYVTLRGLPRPSPIFFFAEPDKNRSSS